MTKHYISYYSINEWRMKLVIQLYTWEIFMFIPVNKYRMWFPRIRLCKMYAHACRIYISKTFQHFSGSKEHRNAKEEVHARESEEKRWEKERKSLDKVRKRGKKWEAEDRIGWTKREERQSEKESSFTRIRIQSACGVRASRIPSVTCFQSLSRYFPSHEICFITDIYYMRMKEAKPAKRHHFRHDFSEWGGTSRCVDQRLTILELA